MPLFLPGDLPMQGINLQGRSPCQPLLPPRLPDPPLLLRISAGGTTLFPNEVPVTDGACRHLHYIYGEGLTAGCAPGSYCPSETLTRAQMAVFLATGFNFTKYGP